MSQSATRFAASTASARPQLRHLFSAVMRFQSDEQSQPVIPQEDREGAYIGSGDGDLTGDLSGSMRWSLYSGNCLYPSIRKGQKVTADLHLCTVNPGGFIETRDGALIRFEGRGYGLHSSERYLVTFNLTFGTEHPRFAWLTRELGVVEGEIDEKAGVMTLAAYVPAR